MSSRTAGPGQLPLAEDMAMGELLRDQGMRLVEAHVDRDWTTAFEEAVLAKARTGERFTVDDIREEIGEPDKYNAWGARFNAMAVGGWIVCVDFVKSHRTKRHAGTNRVWKGTAKAMGGARREIGEDTRDR